MMPIMIKTLFYYKFYYKFNNIDIHIIKTSALVTQWVCIKVDIQYGYMFRNRKIFHLFTRRDGKNSQKSYLILRIIFDDVNEKCYNYIRKFLFVCNNVFDIILSFHY